MKKSKLFILISTVVFLSCPPCFSAIEGVRQDRIIQEEVPVLEDSVRVISSGPCDGAPQLECTVLGVTCQGIPERTVGIHKKPVADPRGTIIFFTGGYGNTFYSADALPFDTINVLYEEGFEIYEIAWDSDVGWGANTDGFGIEKALCGPAKVIEWIEDDRTSGTPLCAQGNSGGSLQIAYPLAVYGLEDILDMVILTGGPHLSRVDLACFGGNHPATWPRLEFLNLFDSIMGYETEGYCYAGEAPDDDIVLEYYDEGLLSSRPRNYSYPETKVNFINAVSDTAPYTQALFFYGTINSEKDWYQLNPGDHYIHRNPFGALKIRQLMKNECI